MEIRRGKKFTWKTLNDTQKGENINFLLAQDRRNIVYTIWILNVINILYNYWVFSKYCPNWRNYLSKTYLSIQKSLCIYRAVWSCVNNLKHFPDFKGSIIVETPCTLAPSIIVSPGIKSWLRSTDVETMITTF